MRRPDEITYYDELGIENNASAEDVREAFRALVRLMHPDQQTDEQLRMMADWQMRKINRIYAVLSDPERRRRYDRSLEDTPSAPAIVYSTDSRINLQRLLARFAWIGAVVVTIAVLIWLASEGPSPASLSLVEHVNAQQGASAQMRDELYLLRSELNTLKAERDAALQELTQTRGAPRARRIEPLASSSTAEPLPSTGQAPSPSAAAAVAELLPPSVLPPPRPVDAKALPTPSQNRFLGFWFYTRPRQGQQNHNKALYLPEYIEATITEQGALVHGRYRSRYQITDRAISPDVNFEFVAAPEAGAIVCSWLGQGGARGELTLKLTGENSMEIAWTATELGSSQGLASGTARLTRRVD